jgi:hypothetical protein
LGAAGFIGSLACLLAIDHFAPSAQSPAEQVFKDAIMAGIASWIFFPSLILTLIPGLLAIAFNRAFHGAKWAWLKAATGILVFAGGLHALAPIQERARIGANVVVGQLGVAEPAATDAGEIATMWTLLLVAVANVVLGVWRQRIIR